MLLILIMAAALAIGIWVGLGAPGTNGREDRVVKSGRARRLDHNYVHWLKTKR
jgi:hypothetical protein